MNKVTSPFELRTFALNACILFRIGGLKSLNWNLDHIRKTETMYLTICLNSLNAIKAYLGYFKINYSK